MALRGNLSTLKGLRQRLQTLPKSLAHNVSQRAAPALTTMTVESFNASRTVYGDARPAGVDGSALTLVQSGAAKASLKFVANGTIVRCVLGTRYTKYLIGKYGVLPNGALPAAWSRKLAQLVKETKLP